MKIVIIGGTGRIGSKLTDILKQHGHDVIAASRSTGVNTVSGEGLDEALSNAQVVVDVSNAPAADATTVLEFFEMSTRHLIAAEKKNGVTHHIALSIVGVERMQPKGYFRAKQAQEKLVSNSGIPYTIVQATQFFEFLGNIAAYGTKGETIQLPAVSFQPIAVDDVAAILASVATSEPANGAIAIAGPEKGSMAGGARVVALSSIGHRHMGLRLEDVNFEKNPFDKMKAYGQSKTANSLFAVELDRIGEEHGVRAFAVHPGAIQTDIFRYMTDEELQAWSQNVNDFKTPQQGAATSVWCALSDQLNGKGGVYCENCDIAAVVPDDSKVPTGVRSYAIDPVKATALWQFSETATGVRWP